MGFRFSPLVAVSAILFVLPLTGRSQTDTALKVSSSNSRAVAEFRAGVNDLQNISFESAASHFKAAIDTDPNSNIPHHDLGYKFQIDFNQPGTYTFHCKLHPSVGGTVNVSAAPAK